MGKCYQTNTSCALYHKDVSVSLPSLLCTIMYIYSTIELLRKPFLK